MDWTIRATDEVKDWLTSIEDDHYRDHVEAAIELLAENGPTFGRPFVDHIKGSSVRNLKELRPKGPAKHCRILFAFDPNQQALLLIAGDKEGNWDHWYKKAISQAEALYAQHLDELS